VNEEQVEGQDPELTFPEMMLSDIAADVAKIRRNTGFLATVVLVYLVVVGLSFVFVLFANVGS
jgi:hypothetical protein